MGTKVRKQEGLTYYPPLVSSLPEEEYMTDTPTPNTDPVKRIKPEDVKTLEDLEMYLDYRSKQLKENILYASSGANRTHLSPIFKAQFKEVQEIRGLVKQLTKQ